MVRATRSGVLHPHLPGPVAEPHHRLAAISGLELLATSPRWPSPRKLRETLIPLRETPRGKPRHVRRSNGIGITLQPVSCLAGAGISVVIGVGVDVYQGGCRVPASPCGSPVGILATNTPRISSYRTPSPRGIRSNSSAVTSFGFVVIRSCTSTLGLRRAFFHISTGPRLPGDAAVSFVGQV